MIDITLIERLEALTAPNFAIEQEIGRIVNPQATSKTIFPAYTASIDAAITLVPEGDYDQGWGRSSRAVPHGFKLWQVRISLETVEEDSDETGPVALGEHDYPAIALCIAALKAREAT